MHILVEFQRCHPDNSPLATVQKLVVELDVLAIVCVLVHTNPIVLNH